MLGSVVFRSTNISVATRFNRGHKQKYEYPKCIECEQAHGLLFAQKKNVPAKHSAFRIMGLLKN